MQSQSKARFVVLLFSFAASFMEVRGQTDEPAPLSAEAVMARVAANQDRAEAERARFVYVQHATVQSRKGNIVMCEETTDMRVTPSPTGQHQALLALDGHVRDAGRMIHYTAMPQDSGGTETSDHAENVHSIEIGDRKVVVDADKSGETLLVHDTDIDLVENMRRNFTSDENSKDGIRQGLFPLTSNQQKDLAFELKDRESKNGHDTFHIIFRPRNKVDYTWKGDAWIEARTFEPVVVRTALSRSLPIGVRVLLGTNLLGLGFTVVNLPQTGGVWFPASFGTEFKVKVLFLFHRQIIINVVNRDFERTHATATVHTEAAQPVAP